MHRIPATIYAAALPVALALCACATLGDEPRAARSTSACVRLAVNEATAQRDLGDAHAHCLGAAAIAQRCSVLEAVLASYAKELRDAFGRGDAQLRDLRAGYTGIRCAHRASTEPARCCEAQGY